MGKHASPGSYSNPFLFWEGEGPPVPLDQPLVSSPRFEFDGFTFEWMPPKYAKPSRRRGQGGYFVRIRAFYRGARAVFSLAVVEPTEGEPFLGPMLEDFAGLAMVDGPSQELILELLRFEHAARCGDESVLGAVAAAEFAGGCQRLAERGAAAASAAPATGPRP